MCSSRAIGYVSDVVDTPDGRLGSSAEVVGRLDPPPGVSWDGVLASPGLTQLAVIDFQARAARALGVSASKIYLQTIARVTSAEEPRKPPRHWHCDGFAGGHVLCVLGVSPTEFLLGSYTTEDIRAADRGERFERLLTPWRPLPGELVRVNNYTIHRKPSLDVGRRLFLVATLDKPHMEPKVRQLHQATASPESAVPSVAMAASMSDSVTMSGGTSLNTSLPAGTVSKPSS